MWIYRYSNAGHTFIIDFYKRSWTLGTLKVTTISMRIFCKKSKDGTINSTFF